MPKNEWFVDRSFMDLSGSEIPREFLWRKSEKTIEDLVDYPKNHGNAQKLKNSNFSIYSENSVFPPKDLIVYVPVNGLLLNRNVPKLQKKNFYAL